MDNEQKKPRSPKKDIIMAIAFIVLGAVLIYLGTTVMHNHPKVTGRNANNSMYYLGQAIIIAAVGSFVMGLRSLIYFIKAKFGEQIAAVLKKVEKFLSFILEWLYLFICRILGIDPDRFFARGKDKRSFRRRRAADDDGIRLTNPISKKYKDQRTNIEKIRFLYRRFMQRVIKKGYKFKYAKTPVQVREEIREDWMDKEDQALLVNLYVDNRYARPEKIAITDSDVEVCRGVKS